MKTTLAVLAAVAISGMASANSTFQSSAPSLEGVAVKIGVAFPLDNRVKDAISSNLTSIGLEFGTTTTYGGNTESFLGVDYFGQNLATFGKGSFVPVTYNVRFFKNSESSRRTYTVVGVGLGFANFDSSETLIVGRGGFGVDVSDHTFFEAVGTVTNSGSGGAAFNTVGLYFGYRF